MKNISLILLLAALLTTTAHATKAASGHTNRSGITLYKRSARLKPPNTIKLDKVVVVQETDYSLILDVFYTYQDDAPDKEVKLVVLPDMPYWTSNPALVEKGSNVGRVSIDLYTKKMDEDMVAEYETSKLTVSFDHYAPGKFNGSLYKEIIPFMKTWKPRKAKRSIEPSNQSNAK